MSLVCNLEERLGCACLHSNSRAKHKTKVGKYTCTLTLIHALLFWQNGKVKVTRSKSVVDFRFELVG